MTEPPEPGPDRAERAQTQRPRPGPAEAELLRRLNERLDAGLPASVRRDLIPRLAGESAEAAGLGAEVSAEVTDAELVDTAVCALVRLVAAPPEPVPQRPVPAEPASPAVARPLIRRLPGALRRRVRGRLQQMRDIQAHRRSLRAARARIPEPVAYVHIGLPKTGTTYLQALLAANRGRLERAGVRYPTDRLDAHFFAALDLMGRGFRGHRYQGLDGAWDRVAGQVRDWPGVSVISHEILVRANAEHVSRLVDSLAPARVEVILTVRDLARQLPAVWQEQLKLGHDYAWPEYTAAVQAADPTGLASAQDGDAEELEAEEQLREAGSDRAAALHRFGRRFWRARDAAAVAARWAAVIPPERIHVVTVPPPGAGQDLLWERFATVVGVQATDFPPPAAQVNTSLGPAEAELLRRLNPGLVELLAWEDYERLVKWKLAEQVLASRPSIPRMVLPPGQWPWVRTHSQRIVDGLAAAGYSVSGSLADLLPASPEPADGARRPDETDDAEVLDAALDALAGLVRLRADPGAG